MLAALGSPRGGRISPGGGRLPAGGFVYVVYWELNMASAVSKSDERGDPLRPYFVPGGVDFDALSEELKAAIAGIVNPAYRLLVLEARDGLEKSAGVTVVHLLWLEILDQLDLAESMQKPPHPGESEERGKLIERHLRVVGAKSKASHFLFRLRELRRKLCALPPFDPFRRAAEPLGDWAANHTEG